MDNEWEKIISPRNKEEEYLKYDYVRDIMNDKEKKMKDGYEESDFTEEYWTTVHESTGLSRMTRPAGTLVIYFQDLFSLLNINGTILEVGSGAGSLLNNLRLNGFTAEGCEFSSSGKSVAKKYFNIDLKDCDLRKRLPYKDNEFDFVLSAGVLSMIPIQYMENALSECLRVSKYGFFLHVSCMISGEVNLHHITAMSTLEYWKMLTKLGAVDMTTIQTPQKVKYGIGLYSDFSALWCKKKNLTYWNKLPKERKKMSGVYFSETQKIREEVLPYCVGKGIDIGCGNDKITKESIGLDCRRSAVVDVIMNFNQAPLPFEDNSLDFVYSSHTLEHIPGDLSIPLKEWCRVLKENGFLILYLPHKDLYTDYNSEHFHQLDSQTVLLYLTKVMSFEIVENRIDKGEDKYSFVLVVKKRG